MRYLFILLLMTLPSVLWAQTAKQCFLQMPDSLCPLLTAVNKADCIDFLESKMKAEVTNRFGGKSEMTTLTESCIALQLTEQTSWQMKLLPVEGERQIVCVVSTACAPACDSHIRFYTTDWQPLPSDSYLPPLPTADDFIVSLNDSTAVYAYRDARRQADLMLLKADLAPDEPLLTLTFTTPDYMDAEAAEKLRPYLRGPLLWHWNGGKFVE